ncbi:MAG: hypothetical protein KR126chlam3_01543 [Chlamydiae bacterium]|nr:hypothetical protein [Chlamydiota bacterium]
MHKIIWGSIFFTLLACGCGKVDTSPDCILEEIREDISCLTGETIYWNHHPEHFEFSYYILEILEAGLTEETAVHIALINNRRLQAIYEDLGVGKAQLIQAGLLKNPVLPFSYLFSLKSKVSALIDIGIFQNFLDILLIPLKKRVAETELEATKMSVKSQILEVIYQTRMLFLTLQANQQNWELKKRELLAAELIYSVAERLLEAGNIWQLELSQFRMQYEEMKIVVAEIEMGVIRTKEKLNQMMGLWGTEIDWSFCSCFPEILRHKETLQEIENAAISQNLDLKIAHLDLLATAARFGVDTTRLIYPQLDVGIATEREDSVWYLGPAFVLPLPLFDWGRANSALAQAEICKRWNDYIALAIDIRSHARLARFEYLNSLRQINYYEHVLIPLAEVPYFE